MITRRNQDVINFISEFHVATSSQIQRLIYPESYRYCMKELKKMRNDGYIKKMISTINNCHAYYIDRKPVQIHHDLIRSELFINIREKFNITSWSNETPIKNIRPDAFCFVSDHGISFPLFIEIHLSNKFDFDKYKELIRTADLKAMFGIIPRVLICTDRNIVIPNIGVKFKIVELDMSGLESLLK